MSQTMRLCWFIFYKDQLLLEKNENGTFTIPYREVPPINIKEKTTIHDITILGNSICKSFSITSPVEESEQFVMVGLRASYEFYQ